MDINVVDMVQIYERMNNLALRALEFRRHLGSAMVELLLPKECNRSMPSSIQFICPKKVSCRFYKKIFLANSIHFVKYHGVSILQ